MTDLQVFDALGLVRGSVWEGISGGDSNRWTVYFMTNGYTLKLVREGVPRPATGNLISVTLGDVTWTGDEKEKSR